MRKTKTKATTGKLQKSLKKRSGSALLLTTILLFVILSMVVSLTYVTVMEQKMSSKTKSSIGSFYSAESGIEWALNKIANTTESTISGAFGSERFNSDGSVKCPDSFGADICKVYLLDQNGKVITDSTADLSEVKAVRSVGTQGNETTRAIEAAVAATGGGCYTCYSGTDTTSCCQAPFTQTQLKIGTYGECLCGTANGWSFYRPPGGGCADCSASRDGGTAYACCK